MMVLADGDADLSPEECRPVSLGYKGGGGWRRKQGKRETNGGTFQVPSSLLLATREEAERYLQLAMGESDGDKGDDEAGGGDKADDKGDGADNGGGKE